MSRWPKPEHDPMLGRRFGRLTVWGRVIVKLVKGDKDTRPRYLCKCSCGSLCVVRGHSLRAGLTKSCGCLKVECGRKLGLRILGRKKGSDKT